MLILSELKREFLSIGMRPRSILARILLTFVCFEIAMGDLVRPVPTEFWRFFSLLFVGWALSSLIEREQGFQPQTDPPLLLAGAVTIGFAVRGAVDLLLAVMT